MTAACAARITRNCPEKQHYHHAALGWIYDDFIAEAQVVAVARIEVFAASTRDDCDAIDHACAAEEPQDARPRLIRRGKSRLTCAGIRLTGGNLPRL